QRPDCDESAGGNQVGEDNPDQSTPLSALRSALPALRSVVSLAPNGDVIRDSADMSSDATLLRSALKQAIGRPFYYTSNDDGSQIYLLLRQSAGSNGNYWAVRMVPDALKGFIQQPTQDFQHLWRLEKRVTQQV
ncbi:hypothetical protein, partial [Pseudomonas viridiflava]|uniref:hypothetical protein n=1 Tax=Pseudomonas viridiflava TaxID=33069 RepID=UPI0013DE93F2